MISIINLNIFRYIKGNSSTCNTPRKITGTLSENVSNVNTPLVNGLYEYKEFQQDVKTAEHTTNPKSNGDDSYVDDKKNVSRELFTIKDNLENSKSDFENEIKRKSLMRDSPREDLELLYKFDSTMTSTPIHASNHNGKVKQKSYNLSNQSLSSTLGLHDQSSGKSKKILQSSFEPMLSGNSNSNKSKRIMNLSNSSNRRTSTSTFSLADFINTSTPSNKNNSKKKKNTSNTTVSSENGEKNSSIFSNDDFPSLSQDNNKSDQSNKRVSLNSSNLTSTPVTILKRGRGEGVSSAANNDNGNLIVRHKKRVVPITVSNKISRSANLEHQFMASSFQSDNNLLNFTSTEFEKDQEHVNERFFLRNCKESITKDFTHQREPEKHLRAYVKESMNVPCSPAIGFPASPCTSSAITVRPPLTILNFDKSKVTNESSVIRFAQIYAFIIDMNFVPNVLTELSYLINLLNTEKDPYESIQIASNHKNMENLLRNIHNCLYFAIKTLNYEKSVLAMLDNTTLKVLIDNERIKTLDLKLFEYLKHIHQCKSQLDGSFILSSQLNKYRQGFDNNNISSSSVLFQQENDGKCNFPSDKEFGAFKKQRDMFYSILRYVSHFEVTLNV